MRARLPDSEGFVERGGVKIHYEVHGTGGPTILLMPTWTIIHKRFWKGQVPYLARHFRVVTYDGPGNGRSDRPLDPAAYAQESQVAYALAVLDATRTDQAVLVGLSMAANWALDLAANHPSRVHGTVLIGPTVALTPPSQERVARISLAGPAPDVEPSRVPRVQPDPPEHWVKYNREYWEKEHEDFLWFFLGQCFPEPHSTKQIEDGVGWGLSTSGQVLVAKSKARMPDAETLTDWCRRLTGPVLLIHGDEDRISPLPRSEILRELTGGELVTLAGAGHVPLARDPVRVNLLIGEFAARFRTTAPPPRTWTRGRHRPKRVLYLSSPIGLGHARRDVAIAAALRDHHPDVEIDWLAQHPVTRVLEAAGERVHPASAWLANESAHIEDEAGEHDLHCFEALRRMDEVLLSNYMVFHDAVRETPYDLVVGDEAWDVDYFLHENPELKRFAYAWFTDFVGYLPMPDGGERESLVTADYNAEMIEHIARYPRIRDRAIFVGEPDDVVSLPFGPGLPAIRDWTEEHYDFTGYVTGFDPAGVADRAALRAELGYAPDERVCVVTVGGSGVGEHLLRRVVGSFDAAAARVPGLRMVVVTGPRIDPSSFRPAERLEIRPFVPDLHRHLAASDLAIVQGGLTTCMELTAAGRPFIYVPLRHHFEQQIHVAHRLRRHGAGRRLDYDDTDPDTLAEAIAAEIGREVEYRPVDGGGAARAAALLADLL
jgi:pimeloyl-ACP methyl ester carboxylesterase/predicted glycosyltransferase